MKAPSEYTLQELNDRVLQIALVYNASSSVRLVLYSDGSGHLEAKGSDGVWDDFFHFDHAYLLFETSIEDILSTLGQETEDE